ncbi:ABC transporter substrate-binding protein [Dubosiella newyorkensis]|jgi:iron complex transport system substrate-binding protein|uniref:ABC transporter substrate-binding protein n=3 Tax=Dubosiella newyorkensis TaxID=1862672 RepID=UPI002356944F|nr:ABC transporter substrate-binding protein [Dubosiella newyorkensis]MCI9041856.1 ABC transporter substrate-binding protein [Dubosiella newyorkensis]
MKSLKKVGVLFTLLITTLAMVGCASTTTEEKSTAMKTVQTDKGEVEIPENPKRIISDYYLGEFLAVGVKPIIASPYALNNPYLKDDIEGIEPMNITSSETTLEQFSAAKPDLIVTITEADYEKYSKIAPTVYIQDGKRSDDETFEYIASLVGKEKEAKDYIEKFLQKAEEHKQEIQDIVKDQTVSIVEVWPQQIYTMGSHFARGGRILYDLWDLKAPEKIQKEMVDGDKQYEVVSLEALPEYAGDFVLYGVLDGTDPAFVTSSNLWNSLPAVKNGKTLPYEQVSFMHRDPITQSKQLEIFIDFFEQFKE